ncbi:MAG: hypothetical protein GY822_18640 [Deltaproteobacteria bacterium]|nr:hypothetical protein [Deltaproteobacteria bacterium]
MGKRYRARHRHLLLSGTLSGASAERVGVENDSHSIFALEKLALAAAEVIGNRNASCFRQRSGVLLLVRYAFAMFASLSCSSRLYLAPVALLLFVLSSACSFSVDDVEPVSGPAFTAQQIEVHGARFTLETQFSLLSAGVEVTCPTLEVNDEGDLARVAIPASAPAGIYDVIATEKASSASLDAAFSLTEEHARIRFVDVGQGDATLLELPDGKIVLIDGGKFAQGDEMKSAIDDFSAGRIDLAVISHFDEDHLGGWVEVLMGDDGEPGTGDDVNIPLFSPTDSGSCTTQVCGRMRDLLAPLRTPDVGQVLAASDDVVDGENDVDAFSIEVVALNGETASGPVSGATDENERSLVLLFRYGGLKILINGDLTGGGQGSADVETPLSELTGAVDVLRTGHHGSKTSSNDVALGNWSPLLSVISAGTNNAFCHPDNAVLQRIADHSGQVWITGNGVLDSTDRCDATLAPANAIFGKGDVELELFSDGRLLADSEPL